MRDYNGDRGYGWDCNDRFIITRQTQIKDGIKLNIINMIEMKDI